MSLSIYQNFLQKALGDNRLADQVERLAHHALQGEVWDKAVMYRRQAGLKAATRSVHREAVTHFEQALVALERLPERCETIEQAIDLRFDLHNSLIPLGAYDQVFDHLHQAETLAEGLQDRRRLGRLSAYMAHYLWATVHHERAVEVGLRACTLATELGDLPLQVMANHTVAYAYHDLADYRPAMDLLRQNIALLEGDLIRESFGLPVLPSSESRRTLAWCLTWQGKFAEAITVLKEAAHITEAANHPWSVVMTAIGDGVFYLLKGDLDEAIPPLERASRSAGPGTSLPPRQPSPSSAMPIPLQAVLLKPSRCSSNHWSVQPSSSFCPAIRSG